MLRGKSGNFRNFFFHNNIIFHNLYLFLPATYTLRVLIDAPQLINFLIFFAPISSPLLIPTPLFILFSNSLETKKFFSFTLTDIHARYYQILLIFLTLIVVWGQFLYSEVRQTRFSQVVQTPPYPLFLPVSQIFGNIPPHLFIPRLRLLSIWVNSKFPVYSPSPSRTPSLPPSIRALRV